MRIKRRRSRVTRVVSETPVKVAAVLWLARMAARGIRT
jgi:hypothetical protein